MTITTTYAVYLGLVMTTVFISTIFLMRAEDIGKPFTARRSLSYAMAGIASAMIWPVTVPLGVILVITYVWRWSRA